MAAKEKSSKMVMQSFGVREMIRETIFGFVFWSLFQALAPMIWFYPLNEMEISGYEAYAMFFLSPCVLGIGPLWRAVQNRWGLAVVRLLAIACVASFQAPTTLSRLIILAVGCGFQMIAFTASLWHQNQHQRSLGAWGTILGLFALLSSRVWYTSFIPTWWDNISNTAVITLGVAAVLDKIIADEDYSAPPKPISPVLRLPWYIGSIGLGTQIFLTHWIFGEVSIVTRWTVRAYPDTGPMPYPWGLPVLIFLWMGASLSPCRHVVGSRVWWLIGCGSLAGLYWLETWTAYSCGLVLAIFTMSLWPEVLDRVTACPPARTVTFAGLLYVVYILYEVWTVAYNFVPGGEFTREHTDRLLVTVLLALGVSLFWYKRTEEHKPHSAFIPLKEGKMPNGTTTTLLLLIVLAGIGGFAYRYPSQTFSHPPKSEKGAEFIAGVWTYHFGYDNRGWPSLNRGADFLTTSGADVVALLESDASKPFLGNNDFGAWLTENLGIYVDFGPPTRDHTWGNLIISKYPIVKSTHYLLPSPYGELAPAIRATVNMTGHLVDFLVTHMGNDQDDLDRRLQAQSLAEALKTAENPIVFLGYVTSLPGSRDYRKLTEGGNVKDIDKTDTERWCEYIMYRGLIRLGYARVSHGGLSDTELQMARFRIPDDPENYEDNANVVTDPSKVDASVHFPDKFGKYRAGHNWNWKHKYHMGTPKYFTP